MFNEKRIEKIRKNIQISTILSDHEKSDWLNLLDLMNDKQLGELEEILGAMPAVPMQNITAEQPPQQPAPAPRPALVQDASMAKMPPLSHIANIPTDVTMTHSVPQPAVNPAPAPAPRPPSHITPRPTQQPTQTPRPTPAPRPAPAPVPVKPQPVAQPKPQSTAPLKKLTIDHTSDIQTFDVSTLRQYDLQSVVDAIRATIQANGYFHVLQQLEASPLYRSYIETGKFMLGHGTVTVADPEITLTQTEFEFITDLLRHMRFNTW